MTQAARGAGQAFPPTRRVRRRPEFQRVYDHGERVRARLMTVMVLTTDRPVSRLGIAATRKLGGAVVRNRAKRIIREVFRRAQVPSGLDIVVIPRPELLDAEYRIIESEFGYVLRRAGRPSIHQQGQGPADRGRGATGWTREERRAPRGTR